MAQRLARLLCKDDMQIPKAFHILKFKLKDHLLWENWTVRPEWGESSDSHPVKQLWTELRNNGNSDEREIWKLGVEQW